MADDAPTMTVEELARQSGMTVRNIRNHQSRGLLPPPEVRARIGYYGPEHLERLQLIQDMQASGFNLSAIGHLVGGDGGADRLLGFRRAVTATDEAETPEILTRDELTERFGPFDDKLLARTAKLELLVPLGGDRFEAPSPALLRAAEEAMARGIDLRAALRVMEKVRRNARDASRAFVELFLDELWKPFEEEDVPAERWAEVAEALERLRPLAAETLLATFRQTMAAEVEDAFSRVLERRAKGRR